MTPTTAEGSRSVEPPGVHLNRPVSAEKLDSMRLFIICTLPTKGPGRRFSRPSRVLRPANAAGSEKVVQNLLRDTLVNCLLSQVLEITPRFLQVICKDGERVLSPVRPLP